MARQSRNSQRRDYPIQEDMALQERVWRFERAAWIVLFVMLVAALLGVFSRGPLSAATARDPDGRLVVDYERFERSDAATSLTLHIRPTQGSDTTSLRLSPEFLRGFTVTGMQPEPVASSAGPRGLLHVFRSDGNAFTVHMATRPRRAGMVRSRIGIEDGPSVQLTQFTYP